MKKLFLLFGLLIPAVSFAGGYSIIWSNIAGGGGTNSSSGYSLKGTIGQPEAHAAGSNGFSLSGGFWGVLQTLGGPNLGLIRSNNSVTLSWATTPSGYILQQNPNLRSTNWTASSYTVTTNGPVNTVTVTSPTGNMFFRLKYEP
jgi:hypothetical protein